MKKTLVIMLVIMFAVSCIPYETTFLPEMTLRVVDENGEPYQHEFVAQYCKNDTLSVDPCDAADSSKLTDENGYVTFPARKIRANLLYRTFRPILSLLLLLAHGGWGTNAHILAPGPQGNTRVEFNPEGPYPTEIIASSKMRQ